MNNPMSRRTFLGTLGGAAILLLDFLYPGLPQVRRIAYASRRNTGDVETLEGFDNGFACGKVVEKTAGGVVLRSELGTRAVRFGSNTLVWKEFYEDPGVIEIGDWLDVRGTPLNDGTLLARSKWVWVNIGRREGTVVDVAGKRIAVRTARGTEVMEQSPVLTVVDARNPEVIIPSERVRPGVHVGAVGLRLPDGGFRATRIWVVD